MSWEDKMNERFLRAICCITFWNVAMLRSPNLVWFDLGAVVVMIAAWTWIDHRKVREASGKAP